MFESLVKNRLFKKLHNIEYGKLSVTLPDGKLHQFVGQYLGIEADISLKDWRVISQLINKGNVGFADDYRDNYWDSSNIEKLLLFGLYNPKLFNIFGRGNFIFKQLSKILYFAKRNTIKGSRKNIQAHYDLGNDFYQLWLDKTMTYSSAIFKHEDESLESAQCNKYQRLLNKITKPNAKILEIGCGWGAFAEIAGLNGHVVKGITLSKEQYDYAKLRNKHLDVDIVMEDYREQYGKYDAIVSIEMLEAVGEKYWNTYFSKLAELIKDDGKILLQVITIDDQLFPYYRKSGDMIRTFIFPGGMLLCEKIIKEIVVMHKLKIDEIYYFGRDYAKTLRIWLDNFDREYEQIKKLGFDNKFIRLWRFYLAFCSAGFEHGRINVMQLELSKELV